MSKIRLGKTGDSRTRKQEKAPETVPLLPKNQQAYESFYRYLLQQGYSSKTAGRYIIDTLRFTAWAETEGIAVNQVRYADVLAFMQSLKARVSQRSLSAYLNGLKHYFTFLEAAGEITENPVNAVQIKGIRRRRLYHILSKAELESLYYNFKDTPPENSNQNQNWYKVAVLAGKRNKVMLGLLVYQGVSSEELSRLKEADMKLREGKVFIAGGRRSNERELKLEAHQVLDIMEYALQTRKEFLKQTGKSSGSFFVSAGGSESIRSIIDKLIKKLRQQNGNVSSVKQIRASVITHWLKRYNLREAQYKAGHRFVSSTEGYLVNDVEDLQEEILRFHPLE